MEQHTSLLDENSPYAVAQSPLHTEIDHGQELPLNPEFQTSEVEQMKLSSAQLSQLAKSYQKRTGRLAVGVFVSACSLWSLLYLLCLDTLIHEELTGELATIILKVSALFWLLPFCVVGLVSFIKKPNGLSRKQGRQMSEALASLDDVRTVGPLIDALKVEDSKTHQAAVDALIHLLPRLQANDAELLNAEQRTLLCRHLSRISNRFTGNIGPPLQVASNKGVSFRVAILQAFAQVGDSTALPTVERLAQGTAKTEGQKRIREAAIACLPALQHTHQISPDGRMIFISRLLLPHLFGVKFSSPLFGLAFRVTHNSVSLETKGRSICTESPEQQNRYEQSKFAPPIRGEEFAGSLFTTRQGASKSRLFGLFARSAKP